MDGTMNLLPVTGMGGTQGGAAALGGAGGALVGSLLFGRNGLGLGGYGDTAVVAGGASNGFTTQYILDQIQANSAQMDTLITGQTALLNTNSAQILKSVSDNAAAIVSVGNNIERSVMNGTAQTQLTSCQETNALTNTINALGSDIALANANQAAAMANCCCQTQRAIDGVNFQSIQNTCAITGAIRDDGAATRALINDLATQELRDKLCDAKSQIAALQAEQYLNDKMQGQTALIVQHVAAICGNCKDSSGSSSSK